MRQTTVYNAFTGISPGEKTKLANFICNNCPQAKRPQVVEAISYALKEKPSFGGFVLAVKKEHQYLAAIVVNNTGMEGYGPGNIFAYVTVAQTADDKEKILEEIMCKALDMSNGDVSLRLERRNPIIKLFKKLGFTNNMVELRLDRTASGRATA